MLPPRLRMSGGVHPMRLSWRVPLCWRFTPSF